MPKVTQGVSCRGRIQTQRPALHLVFRQGPPVPEAACVLAGSDAAGRSAHARKEPLALWLGRGEASHLGSEGDIKKGVRGRMRPQGKPGGSETLCPTGAAQPERTRDRCSGCWALRGRGGRRPKRGPWRSVDSPLACSGAQGESGRRAPAGGWTPGQGIWEWLSSLEQPQMRGVHGGQRAEIWSHIRRVQRSRR